MSNQDTEIIPFTIDVTKIDKDRLFDNGKGAKYLDCVLFLKPVDQPDRYGKHGMIVESVSKDERERGIQGNILGNAKRFTPREPVQAQSPAPAQKPESGAVSDADDDIPF